jgi:hypothetical protein
MRLAFFSLLAAAAAFPQELRVYSEFVRLDPAGNPTIERPREILSPAVARNAFASFQVVVAGPSAQPVFLYVQQNPDLLQATLYRRENGRLRQVSLPYAIMPLPEPRPAAEVFWLDVWVPAATPVRRMRLEVLMKSGSNWVIYPMEPRVMKAVVPDLGRPAGVFTMRKLIGRNVAKDRALARAIAYDFSAAPASPDSESYLALRDSLYRAAQR